MKNCYDCNHCEVCKWIDKFKDKGVCDFYKGDAPLNEVLDKIRAEIDEYKDDKIIHAERNEMIDIVLDIIDKYRKEQE